MVAATGHFGNHGGSTYTSQPGRSNGLARAIKLHRSHLISGFPPEQDGSIRQSGALDGCGTTVADRRHWSSPARFVRLVFA